MKNFKLYTLCAGLLGLTACSKVLDKTDLSKLTPELVFNDSTLVQLNMDNIYDVNLPLWGGQNTSSSLSGVQPQLSEESSGSSKYMDGTMSYGTDEPKDYGTSLNTNNTQPNTNWGKIRQLNTFIVSMTGSPLPDYTKRKFIAQARFFRAFRYWDLVRIYGGVPLVLTPLDGVGNEAPGQGRCVRGLHRQRNVVRPDSPDAGARAVSGEAGHPRQADCGRYDFQRFLDCRSGRRGRARRRRFRQRRAVGHGRLRSRLKIQFRQLHA